MPGIDLFLWSRVKTGDKEAFHVLFEKYYAVLCLLSRKYTHDINNSREIIQTLFINLWERRSDLNITNSVKSYLYQSARFNSIRYLENSRRTGISLDEIADWNEDPKFNDHIEYAELQEKIIRVVDDLPDQCRKVFKMSRFEHLKQMEIAEKLSISVKTVESHIAKALKILDEKLQEDLI